MHAARSKNEQNIELCRNMANNMLLYRAIKPICKGEPMLAWYSTKVQQELCNMIIPTSDYEDFNELLMSTENGRSNNNNNNIKKFSSNFFFFETMKII